MTKPTRPRTCGICDGPLTSQSIIIWDSHSSSGVHELCLQIKEIEKRSGPTSDYRLRGEPGPTDEVGG